MKLKSIVMRQLQMVGTARRAVRGWLSPERSPRRGAPTLSRPAVTKALQSMSGVLAAVASLWLCGGNLFAQNDNGGPGGNFDPAQFRQRMMEQVRKNLDVTNDEEWSVVQPLIQKVMEARREAGNGGGMGMGPGGPPPGAGPGGPPPGGGPGGFGPPRNEEQTALQKVIDEKPPVSQIKDALAKYRAAHVEKLARLEAAQADLKGVLTVRQEAAAVLMGLVQ
jgi:hypothetical protein